VQGTDKNLIIGLTAALLLAVGWVVVNLGRVVFSIVQETRRSKQNPPKQIQHREFGALTLDSGLWSGEVVRDGRKLPFCISGTDAEPDGRLLGRLRDVVRRFPEVERAALEFIQSKEPRLLPGKFEISSLNFLWEDKPHLYSLEFF
jgi:hypothetical protein